MKMNKKFLVALLLALPLLSAFLTNCAKAEVFPCERVIHFSRESVARRMRYPLYFNCIGQDKEVKGIGVSNVSNNGANVSTSVHNGGSGMGRYLEITPTHGPGTVKMAVTAFGDSGRSYKTMIEIIVD